MTEPLPMVQMAHVRQIRRSGGKRVCLTGIEAWCQRAGIDMVELQTHGIPGERLAAMDDTFAARALAVAIADQGAPHGREK
jgi:hypothetical protein